MRPSVTALVCLFSCASLLPAQLPPQAPTTLPVAAAAPAPSSLTQTLQPALTGLNDVLPTVRPEKWKLSGDLRRRNADNLASIHGDIANTLPGLLAAADAAPASLPPTLALTRNLDALYDVVLRVAAAAEIGAPDREAAALTGALASLGSARQRIDDRLRSLATTQQQQLVDAQASLQRANAALASATPSSQASSAPKSTSRTGTKPKPKVHRTPPPPPQ